MLLSGWGSSRCRRRGKISYFRSPTKRFRELDRTSQTPSRDAKGTGRESRSSGGGGGARPDRAGVQEVERGEAAEGAAGVRSDLERAVHGRGLGHLRTRRPQNMRR